MTAPRPGTAVYIVPHPDSLVRCGVTEGMARVVDRKRGIFQALGAYCLRMSQVAGSIGAPVLVEQNGIPVFVSTSEIVEAVGVMDACGPRDGVRLVICRRCQRPYAAGRPCPGCGEARWVDRLPLLGEDACGGGCPRCGGGHTPAASWPVSARR